MGTQKMARRQAGYTIVEVSLFLAISALLFILTLIGTGNSIKTTRFSDSSRSFVSYLQKQYDDLANGVNPRDSSLACSNGVINTGGSTAQTPGTSNCIHMGKVLEFSVGSGEVKAYPVIGVQPSNAASQGITSSDAEVIHSYQPRVVREAGVDTFSIPWGAFVQNTKRDDSGQIFDTVLFIYNPVTSEIETDLYDRPNDTYTDVASLIDPSNGANQANINQAGSICLASADGDTPGSRVYLGGSLYQSSIQLEYEIKPEDCDGV